jgi:hypothetical protein
VVPTDGVILSYPQDRLMEFTIGVYHEHADPVTTRNVSGDPSSKCPQPPAKRDLQVSVLTKPQLSS